MKEFRLFALCFVIFHTNGQVRCSVSATTVHCSFICVLVCIMSVNMSEFTRPLTVRFSSRGFTRLEHEEVLESLEENIDPSSVRAIQITENACFVTLSSNETKEILIMISLTLIVLSQT